MINTVFKDKYKFVSEYFETFFKSQKRFPQSIILEGSDILAQYFFALEIARICNCEKDGDENCVCTNCKWIKEDKHPSVINVTPLDFKEDSSRTVISVKQIEKITSIINETSDYHRFFIFSNAKNMPLSKKQQEALQKYGFAGFQIKEDWFPYPINRKILQEEASNALLKSTEEAPDKVTFIFLTNTKDDIIQTIISRSLIFKMPSGYEKSTYDCSEFFKNYPNSSVESLLASVEEILVQSAEIDIFEILDSMQEYLTSLLKENLNMTDFILEDIKKIQEAKRQITALVLPKNALEALAIGFSKEGRNL